MKTITLGEKFEGKYLGKMGDENDYDLLVDEDTTVLKPSGEILCVVLKNHLSISATMMAWSALKGDSMPSRNRGTAAGEEKIHHVRKDGTKSNTIMTAEAVDSGIIGFFERTARMPYCRACAWNLHNPEKWAMINPLVRDVDRLLEEFAKDRYNKQKSIARKSNPDFLIPGTFFSTLTVNKNFRTAYHKDAGNLADGISCMSVMRQGKWTGANLVFPAYRVAAKLDSFDLIIFDPHEIHGNTPLHLISKDAVRCSIVYYFREKIQHCGSAEDELQIVSNRSQGEKLFKTIIRKKGEA